MMAVDLVQLGNQLRSSLRGGQMDRAEESVREYCAAAAAGVRNLGEDDPRRRDWLRNVIDTLDSAIEILSAQRTQCLTDIARVSQTGLYLLRDAAPGTRIGVSL
jgi:hypothetical protein